MEGEGRRRGRGRGRRGGGGGGEEEEGRRYVDSSNKGRDLHFHVSCVLAILTLCSISWHGPLLGMEMRVFSLQLVCSQPYPTLNCMRSCHSNALQNSLEMVTHQTVPNVPIPSGFRSWYLSGTTQSPAFRSTS